MDDDGEKKDGGQVRDLRTAEELEGGGLVTYDRVVLLLDFLPDGSVQFGVRALWRNDMFVEQPLRVLLLSHVMSAMKGVVNLSRDIAAASRRQALVNEVKDELAQQKAADEIAAELGVTHTINTKGGAA